MNIEEFLQILNSGGNLALCMSVYFIWKATERLARIEKALQKYMDTEDKSE
jgi:hypothetical protein